MEPCMAEECSELEIGDGTPKTFSMPSLLQVQAVEVKNQWHLL